MRRLELWFRLHHRQEGLTLIETLVGLAIFAAIGVALMNGLSTGYKTVGVSQERTYAESLAKSQVEYIKTQAYISVVNYDPDDPAKRYGVVDIPTHLTNTGYTIEVEPPEVVEAAGVSGYELQGITIRVKHHGATKLTIVFYRTGLAL
jgi:type II secretory pathway pseudopilin PulG